ncbi:dimethylarginine dimethylaminohydrolase family protein [Thalassobacillus sp. B23F22_16]|uniref:dimethylarginine dimethylaminohydrolase family protein n=1 Tax=Thalassobacillus sp. B23F22_16 TaxID=3459513 RepID=UPI00373EC551
MSVVFRNNDKRNQQIGCRSEFDTLKRVVVCSPAYMRIEEAINETQKKYVDENIDIEKACSQHHSFVEVMRNYNIEVLELEPEQQYHEQVFTRDIGICTDSKVIVSNMGSEVRKGEEELLEETLQQEKSHWEKIQTGTIEGGDIILDKNKVWVGISDRTNESGVKSLQELLPNHQVTAVPIKEEYLHLDCVFNILSPEYALIFPGALRQEEYDMLSHNYELIEVEEDEQFTMGVNVLSIAPGKVISLPQNEKVNKAMKAKGFEVIEVDFSEIIKSGGSFRCCTMPLQRSANK